MAGRRRLRRVEDGQHELARVLRTLVDKQKPQAKPNRLRAWAFRCRFGLAAAGATVLTWLLAGLVDALAVPVATVLLLGVAGLAVLVWATWLMPDSDRRWTVVPAVLAVGYLAATAGGLGGA